MKLELVYYVKVLLLLLRYLRQVIPLVAPRLSLSGKKNTLEIHRGLGFVKPVDIHVLVFRRAVEQALTCGVLDREHAFLAMPFQLLGGRHYH